MFCHLPRLVFHFNCLFYDDGGVSNCGKRSILVSQCCHGVAGHIFFIWSFVLYKENLLFVYWGWKPLDVDFDTGVNFNQNESSKVIKKWFLETLFSHKMDIFLSTLNSLRMVQTFLFPYFPFEQW